MVKTGVKLKIKPQFIGIYYVKIAVIKRFYSFLTELMAIPEKIRPDFMPRRRAEK